ncbi:MAG: AsmA family protein [Reichenbachiella sp.]
MRKFTKVFGILIALLIVLLGAMEVTLKKGFHNKMEEIIREAADENLESKLTFKKLEISIFTAFPLISVHLDSLIISEAGLNLVEAKEIQLRFNIFDLFEESITVEELLLDGAQYHFLVDSTGQKCMIKAKPRPETNEASGSISLNVPKIEIHNTVLVIDNRFKKNYYRMRIMDSDLRVESSNEQMSILGDVFGVMDTVIMKGNLVQTDLPMRAEDAAFRIDKLDKRNIFDGLLYLADVKLQANGVLKPTGNGNLVDIVLSSSKAPLDEYLSLFPDLLNMGYQQDNPDAHVSFRLRNTGFISPIHFPLVNVDFELENAAFSKIGGVGKLDSVFFKGSYSNGKEMKPETSSISIEYGTAKMKDSFVKLSGSVENFISPFIDLDIAFELNIKELQEMFQLPSFQNLDGIVQANLDLYGKLADLDKMNRGNQSRFVGTIDFINVSGALTNDMFTIQGLNGLVEVNNEVIIMNQLKGKLNGSDFSITGGISNYVPLIHPEDERISEGLLVFNVDEMDLPDFSDLAPDTTAVAAESKFTFPNQLNLKVQFSSNRFGLGDLDLESVSVAMNMNQDSVVLREMAFMFKEGKIKVKGKSHFENGINNLNEIYVDADLKNVDVNYWLNRDNKKGNKKKFQMPNNLKLLAEVNIENIYYKSAIFNHLDLTARYHDELLIMDKANINFKYGRLNSNWEIELDSVPAIDGNLDVALTAFDIDSLKLYVGSLKGEKKESKKSFILEDIEIDISSPQVNYQNIVVTDISSNMVMYDRNVRLHHAGFNVFGSDVKITALLERDDSLNTFAKATLLAEKMNMKKLVASFGDSSEIFEEEHFNGEIGIDGAMILKYNESFVHQEQDMIGKFHLDLQDGELIKFEPITESLKFLKQKTTDTINVANRSIDVLFYNDEIMVPSTTFTTNLTNMEFMSYYTDETNFNFNTKVSVSDLLFKSQKKKKAQVGKSKAKVSGISYYLKGRTETEDGLKISSLSRSAYSRQKRRLKARYKDVDEIMKVLESEMIQNEIEHAATQ